MRKYIFNENFFDEINTEQKAYILGILYADGYNREDRGSVSITLKESDKDILDKIKLEMLSNRPLYFINRQNEKDSKNRENQVRLEVNSKYISKRLSQIGCYQRKSLTLQFPSVEHLPENLIRHFIRGFFDGDGCLHLKAGKYPIVNITSNPDILISFKDIINKQLNIKSFISQQRKDRDFNTRQLIITSGQSRIFLDWIYKDSNIHLNRKYKKYKNL